MPAFTGPWAADFVDLWENSASDLERQIIADEQITEEEFVALENWYVGCMANHGLRVTVLENGYDFNTDDDAKIMTGEDACRTGTISTAIWMRGNPDNVPADEAALTCLIRHRDVPADFTLDQYWEELMRVPRLSDWWQELMESGRFPSCMHDPFDLQGIYAAEVRG